MFSKLANVLEDIPSLGEQEDKGLEAVAYVKFFTPWSYWSWYVSEFDGQDTFYGYVVGLENEFGYFSLSDLLDLEGPWGLKVEVDKFFIPTSFKEIVEII